MATTAEITDAIEKGWVYYVEQLEAIRLKLVAGCFVCASCELTCLSSAIKALEYDLETENNTDLTTLTYNLLLSLISNFTGSFTADPTVSIPGITITTPAGDVLQTEVVYPGDGEMSYTFPELIGMEVLTVYRGTSTVLRAHSGAADNEFVQFDSATGEITVSYAFGEGESFWVEYKTV